MSTRDRVLAYLTGLVAIFAFAMIVGRLAGPALDLPQQPDRPHPSIQEHDK